MRINKAFSEQIIYRIGPVDLEIWKCERNTDTRPSWPPMPKNVLFDQKWPFFPILVPNQVKLGVLKMDLQPAPPDRPTHCTSFREQKKKHFLPPGPHALCIARHIKGCCWAFRESFCICSYLVLSCWCLVEICWKTRKDIRVHATDGSPCILG